MPWSQGAYSLVEKGVRTETSKQYLITSWDKCREGNTQEIMMWSNAEGSLETYSDHVVREALSYHLVFQLRPKNEKDGASVCAKSRKECGNNNPNQQVWKEVP